MKNIGTFCVTAAACALLLAIPGAAADKAAAKSTAARPAAVRTATAAKTSMHKNWRPETIAGKIELVEPGQKLLVVERADHVPFDMIVTPATHIQAGGKTVRMNELVNDKDKPVSVRFVPERRGDVAQSIRITG